MLSPTGIGVPDHPPSLFRFGLHHHDTMARAFEPFIAACLPDDCAWEALFTDAQRLHVHRSVYGNRGRPRRFPKQDPGGDSVRAADGSGG